MKKYIVDGMKLCIGENANENSYMVYRASPTDIWFHLSDFPSPHGILYTESVEIQQITSETLEKCALLLKLRSKHKNSTRVSVDILPIKYVENVQTQQGTVILHKTPKKVKV